MTQSVVGRKKNNTTIQIVKVTWRAYQKHSPFFKNKHNDVIVFVHKSGKKDLQKCGRWGGDSNRSSFPFTKWEKFMFFVMPAGGWKNNININKS